MPNTSQEIQESEHASVVLPLERSEMSSDAERYKTARKSGETQATQATRAIWTRGRGGER